MFQCHVSRIGLLFVYLEIKSLVVQLLFYKNPPLTLSVSYFIMLYKVYFFIHLIWCIIVITYTRIVIVFHSLFTYISNVHNSFLYAIIIGLMNSLDERLPRQWPILLIIGEVYTKPQTEGTYFPRYRLVPSNRDHEYDTHRNQHNIELVLRRDNMCGPNSIALRQQMLTWEPSMYRYLLLFLQTTNVPSIKCTRCPDATVCRTHAIWPCTP